MYMMGHCLMFMKLSIACFAICKLCTKKQPKKLSKLISATLQSFIEGVFDFMNLKTYESIQIICQNFFLFFKKDLNSQIHKNLHS